MIVDSSALMAIALGEPEAIELERKLLAADRLRISAGSLLEVRIVMDARRSAEATRALDRVLKVSKIEVVPFTAEHAKVAREAYQRFGKGSGHPANLNFGDCFAYALAAETGEPLLCKGDDFRHTDLELA